MLNTRKVFCTKAIHFAANISDPNCHGNQLSDEEKVSNFLESNN
jgi:hypothetical protein